jgi:hypothetical protein
MNARRALPVLTAVCLLAGCPKHETGSADTAPEKTGACGATLAAAHDPWAAAQAIAEQTGAVGVARWDDEVPYLFQAKGTRGLLVHHGAVLTTRGPAAAASYLRDTGILDGKGPSPRSILTLLYVLRAFPSVPGLPEESAVDTLGPEELRPRIERANGRARVILNYSLPDDNPGPDRGTMPMVRETLEIGPTGDAAWQAEEFVYTRH